MPISETWLLIAATVWLIEAFALGFSWFAIGVSDLVAGIAWLIEAFVLVCTRLVIGVSELLDSRRALDSEQM